MKLVIFYAHAGLGTAVLQLPVGPSWQRSRLHFMCNALAQVSKEAQPLVSATVETISVQPDYEQIRELLCEAAITLDTPRPQVAELLE